MWACAALAAAGCAGAPAPSPACDLGAERGQLTLAADERLNPDANGRPLPTIVRVYQLSAPGPFESASFDALFTDAQATLGETLLGVDELTLYPGETVTRAFERNPEAGFIAGVAIVRRPAGTSFRDLVPLPMPAALASCLAKQDDPEAPPAPPTTPELRFTLRGYQIRGSVVLPEPPDEEQAGAALSVVAQP